MTRISVPHPELLETYLPLLTKNIVEKREVVIAETKIQYSVYTWDKENDPLGLYDEEGNIYISTRVTGINPLYADLLAYHEGEEINLKSDGMDHKEAHWHAYSKELLVAKNMFSLEELRAYINWRLSMYSDERIPKREELETLLINCLTSDSNQETSIHSLVKDSRL